MEDTTIPVIYDSKKIIPAPLISIEKEYVRNEAGKFKKVQFVVTAKGTIVAYKGSPDGDGNFWTLSGYPPDTDPVIAADVDKRLALLRNKMGALSNLFCNQNKLFEIQPYDGSAPITFVPRVRNISFTEGIWVDKVDYTITMETDRINFGTFTLCANEESTDEDVEETWQIEANDEKGRSYKVIHTVSADAKDEYDPAGTGTLLRAGWIVARDDKVVPNLGFDDTIKLASLAKTFDGTWVQYNHIKSENIDEANGKYSLTESWVIYDGGPYYEEYNVSTKTAADTGQNTVSIDGTITGYNTEDEPGLGDAYDNAEDGWTTIQALLITRAQSYSGVTLNANSLNKTVGKNPLTGVITYSYEYNDRPTSTVTGAIRDTVTINDQLPIEIYAKHVCVFRSIGPVIQDTLTRTESRRNLTIEVQMPAATQSFTPTEPDVTSIISTYTPSAGVLQGPYVDKNEKNWSPTNGTYTRNISWFWN